MEDDRLTDVQWLITLGVPVDDIADRAGVSPYSIQLELQQTATRKDTR